MLTDPSALARRLDRQLLRDAAVNLDTEAERQTEHLQTSVGLSSRLKNRIVERRALLWRTAKLLREICA